MIRDNFIKERNKKMTQKNIQLHDQTGASGSNKKKILLAAVIGVLIVAGIVTSQFCCNDKPLTSPSVPAVKKPKETAVIVAVIGNSEKVTLDQLEKVKNAIPQLKDMKMDANLYNKLLDAYINNKVIVNAAKDAKLDKEPAIQKAIEDSRNQILFQAYLSKKLQERATPEALQAVYDKMMVNFVPEEEIHARHILVETEKEARDLIVKLKAGAKFEDLANKYTKDNNPNGNNGGDLGYFKRRTMIPEFSNAAFAIKAGKISEKPVKTPFGWHVIKVEDRRQAAKPTINEVLEEVQAKFTEETVPVIVAEEIKAAGVVKLDPLGLNAASTQAAVQQATVQPSAAKQPAAGNWP